MDFGRAIRVIRAARGYSQRELAQRSGLTPSFISLLESGGRTPSVKTLKALADAFGVPTELITLLASDGHSLRGIPPEEAQELSMRLLRLLADARDEFK